MTNTPVSLGDLPVAVGSGRTQSGANGSSSLFGGLFDAARALGQGQEPASDGGSAPQAGAVLPSKDAMAAGFAGIEGLDASGSEPPAPLTLEDGPDQSALTDATFAPPGAEQDIELGELGITAELSLVYPNLPASAGSSLSCGNSVPVTGHRLPPAGMGAPVVQPAAAMVIAPAAESPPAVAALEAHPPVPASSTAIQAAGVPLAASTAPGFAPVAGSLPGPDGIPLSAQSTGLAKAAAEAAGLAAAAARESARPVSTGATSAAAVKAEGTESAPAAVATATRPSAVEPAAEGARAAQPPPQQSAAGSTVSSSPTLSGELSSAPGRGVMESPADTRSPGGRGSPDPLDAYARAGRANAGLGTGAWDNGPGATRRLSRAPAGSGSSSAAALGIGTALRSGSVLDGSLNDRALAPLQAAFATALVRPAAPRPGSSTAAGADSGPDTLSAAAEASAADTAAENGLSSTASTLRTAEGGLRAEFARQDPVLGAQVAAQIARQIQQGMGSSNLHIKLNPSELGQVDVQLRMDGDRVHVAITTHQSATRDLIETHLSSLRTALENGGLSLGDVDVRHSSQGGPEGGAPGERGVLAGAGAAQRRGRPGTAEAAVDAIPRGLATEGPSGRTIDAFV
ncbi:MAG: flagellar hook-length control protein FliK [Pseudomonadales bacterium]|nr:flagellar hook-length control protein FliK [Pseudomonadales bacterium]